jgi:hypothetical protein
MHTINPQNVTMHISLVGWLSNRTISIASALYTLAVDTWGTTCSGATFPGLFAAIEVDVFEVEGVDVTGNVSVNGEVSYGVIGYVKRAGDREWRNEGRTYPRSVRQILIKRSAPHPATM